MKRILSIYLAALLAFQMTSVTFAQEITMIDHTDSTAEQSQSVEDIQTWEDDADADTATKSTTSETAQEPLLSSEGSQIVSLGYSGNANAANVYLPIGYSATEQRYPTIYLMPQDGLSSEQYLDEGIHEHLDTLMSNDDIMDMIVVMPNFSEGSDFRAATAALVAAVDKDFRTIAKPAQRGVLGVGEGGYMAFILGYTNPETGATLNTPGLFTAVGSHLGNFTNNRWLSSHGDVYDKLNSLSATYLGWFYTYIDGAVDDPLSSVLKSTNAIGALFRTKSNFAYTAAEFTVRPGEHTTEFYQEAMERSFNRFSNRFMVGLVGSASKYSVSPQAVAADAQEITATYSVAVTSLIEDFRLGVSSAGLGTSSVNLPMEIKITMTDPDTGKVLYTEVNGMENVTAGTYTGSFALSTSNMASGNYTTVEVFAGVLGMDVSLGAQSLVKVMPTGSGADEQLIDLMGDWYFNPYKSTSAGTHALDNISNIIPSTYTNWHVVQPGLGWWTAGFGGLSSSTWTGYAWYVREFEIPHEFTTKDGLVLAAGMIDDADVIYINGVKVGATGINENGGYVSSYWEQNRVYNLNSSVLNYDGPNTIAVRMCNGSGGGGWYAGPIGIYSAASYNRITGKPSTPADGDITATVKAFVAQQNDLITGRNLAGYSNTVHPEYFQSGSRKADKVSVVQGWIEGNTSLSIADTGSNVYVEDGKFLYQANRIITGNGGTTLFEGEVEEYYIIDNGQISLYGEHDRFFTQTFYSQARKANIEYRVYLPESYFESDTRYPSMYLLHQLNSTSNAYEVDGIHNIMDKGMAAGDFREMILVIPNSSSSSWWTGTWETMVVDDLLNLIDSRYRTIPDARFRGTMGCSMGGYGSYAVGFNNPDKFTAMISFYGALGSTYNGQNPTTTAQNQSAEYLSRYTHYFICGNRDMYGFGSNAINVDRALRGKGVEHKFFIENGEHDSVFYLPYVYEAFTYVSDRMFSVDGVDNVATGNLNVSQDSSKVDYSVTLSSAIGSYLDVIPASSYTKNTNPDLLVPVTVQITQKSKVVFEETVPHGVKSAAALNNSLEIASYDFNPDAGYTVSLIASILDANVLLDSKTVSAKEIPVSGIQIQGAATVTLKKDAVLSLAASIQPMDATDPSITWSSANSTIVSVDAAGTVTGLKIGMTRITATTANGKTASITVRVTA